MVNFQSLLVGVVATTILSASMVSAHPAPASIKDSEIRELYRRQVANISDVDVLNFACLLEDLENKFYKLCTTKFVKKDYTDAGFDGSVFDQLLLVNDHENTHFVTLQQTIAAVFGDDAVQPECAQGCSYNFPVNSASDCMNVGAILERTGVSAYDGAIRFVGNPDLKNAAASIATVEGRHASFLNVATKLFPVPNAFDTPLGVNPIFSLAASFVKECPRTLPFTAFPLITVDPAKGSVNDEIKLSFEADVAEDKLKDLKVSFLAGLTQKIVAATSATASGKTVEVKAKVPEDVKKFGEITLFVVNDDRAVSIEDDAHVVAGPGAFALDKVVVNIV